MEDLIGGPLAGADVDGPDDQCLCNQQDILSSQDGVIFDAP